MTHADGGFFSAQDADSEGEEGRFYVFTLAELREALGPDADRAARVFGATEGGNFEGSNILHWPKPEAEAAAAEGLSREELDELGRDGAVQAVRVPREARASRPRRQGAHVVERPDDPRARAARRDVGQPALRRSRRARRGVREGQAPRARRRAAAAVAGGRSAVRSVARRLRRLGVRAPRALRGDGGCRLPRRRAPRRAGRPRPLRGPGRRVLLRGPFTRSHHAHEGGRRRRASVRQFHDGARVRAGSARSLTTRRSATSAGSACRRSPRS